MVVELQQQARRYKMQLSATLECISQHSTYFNCWLLVDNKHLIDLDKEYTYYRIWPFVVPLHEGCEDTQPSATATQRVCHRQYSVLTSPEQTLACLSLRTTPWNYPPQTQPQDTPGLKKLTPVRDDVRRRLYLTPRFYWQERLVTTLEQ